MNAVIDNAVVGMQVLGLIAMAYGLILGVMREKHGMSPQAAKILPRY